MDNKHIYLRLDTFKNAYSIINCTNPNLAYELELGNANWDGVNGRIIYFPYSEKLDKLLSYGYSKLY